MLNGLNGAAAVGPAKPWSDDGSGVLRALRALRPAVEAAPPGLGGAEPGHPGSGRPGPGAPRVTLGLAGAAEPGLRPAGPAEDRLWAALPRARAAEFLAGRAAARRALNRAGWPGGDTIELPRAADGVRPRLPDGAVGSISHSGGVAVALAAPAEHCAALGVDLERRPMPPAAGRLVLRGEELRCLTSEHGDGTDPASEPRLRELFSAKESAFKALYGLIPPPLRPTTLLGIAIRPVPGGFHAWAHRAPEPVLHVHTRWAEDAVLTWTAVPREHGPDQAGTAGVQRQAS
ncbi:MULTISPECIES: 4'-phosphopantetheinyl transferase superfamily protein [unclassified Streptomyces]|uniref:4'-phosphopantetheinyl transferase superfamily protein n=1 Tax=unclassified Streptomyces TaxID=2593676 RepID=UPI0022B73C80|nr:MULTISPECIES: 4'-phosphopantetheinyl transferase superfamily protein [unclassified Streptomyces]MCZ7417805.1 4'-phosphopantetheinyl transferase superfamily protein [Streptomyces sp. WMMC897]MCZ7432390.1 4'-phosphopantetheinyl transferase superfamily protein [Streptomyces sp. WMMC1477]